VTAAVPESLDTSRLILRPWGAEAAEMLRRLSADPRVVRYIGDGQVWSDQRVRETSEAMLDHWRAHGFGWWVMTLRETGEEAGFAAINHPRAGGGLDTEDFEIGWWLAPEMWRHGLATEAASAVRDDAFGRLRAPSVAARLQPGNLGSAGVARRIGMTHERDTIGLWGEPVAIYRGWPEPATSPGDAGAGRGDTDSQA
jgi:RimJ/RimL family protein N-acetyltransferase